MVDLVEQRKDNVFQCPKPVEQLRYESEILGPPGNKLRRLKERDSDHWYLFQSGRAVARIAPSEWAKALAGI